MINVALAGTWHVHFEGYAKNIEANPLCKITALWDPDPEKGKKYSEMFNCCYESDYDTLLNRDRKSVV